MLLVALIVPVLHFVYMCMPGGSSKVILDANLPHAYAGGVSTVLSLCVCLCYLLIYCSRLVLGCLSICKSCPACAHVHTIVQLSLISCDLYVQYFC